MEKSQFYLIRDGYIFKESMSVEDLEKGWLYVHPLYVNIKHECRINTTDSESWLTRIHFQYWTTLVCTAA